MEVTTGYSNEAGVIKEKKNLLDFRDVWASRSNSAN